jgi:large subunit ribosomal protein L21
LGIKFKGAFLMFAVLNTGGKQYKVSEGDLIKIEKLESDVGDNVTLDRILMVGEGENVEIGSPYISNCEVRGEVVEQGKGTKIIVFKKRRRKNYRRKNGHRQRFTQLKVTEIIKK